MAHSIDIDVQNISGHCAGLRVHKKKARTLDQKCVELVKVYQTILDNTGSLDVHQIEAALSRTVDFSRQWSNKSFFRQLISQRKIARGIACALKDICDALEVLRAEQSKVHPSTSERHTSFSDVLPPPQAPKQRSIPLPLVSQHSLPNMTSAATIPRSSPRHESRSSTLSSTITGSFSSPQAPSAISLSALSLHSIPGHDSPNTLLLLHTPRATTISRPSPLQYPLAAASTAGPVRPKPHRHHTLPSHHDASLSNSEGAGSHHAAPTGQSYWWSAIRILKDSQNSVSLPSSETSRSSHPASATKTKNQRPKLKIEIPVRRK
ncbi:hypothetical protein NP233_g5331 [Leucocoprinus birnbaumii]|uniref:Uncharacterized protein n=1 Tax=Leucocoprinus birnbaumii TaxID=56174 RepID=A0AAD5VT34_9AGAR|nr:hypothetical protein NP233_g5331 [Leucocoprinus birnbaumii]